MLNNRGQSLVLFVILLPILMFILILVIDIGNVIVLKQELGNISELVLDYGLDNFEEENLINELEELIKFNNKDIDLINVYMDEDRLYVLLEDNYNGLLSSFVDISIFKVHTSFVGYIENNKKRIEKMGD